MSKDLSGVRAALDSAHEHLDEARSEWLNCQPGPESEVLNRLIRAVGAVHTAVDRLAELEAS